MKEVGLHHACFIAETVVSRYYISYSSFMLVKFQLQFRESVLQEKKRTPLNVHLNI